jgi:hypothetical protein
MRSMLRSPEQTIILFWHSIRFDKNMDAQQLNCNLLHKLLRAAVSQLWQPAKHNHYRHSLILCSCKKCRGELSAS